MTRLGNKGLEISFWGGWLPPQKAETVLFRRLRCSYPWAGCSPAEPASVSLDKGSLGFWPPRSTWKRRSSDPSAPNKRRYKSNAAVEFQEDRSSSGFSWIFSVVGALEGIGRLVAQRAVEALAVVKHFDV